MNSGTATSTPTFAASSRASGAAATKYADFAKSVNDFFSKEFPSGVVRVEARTTSRNLLVARPGSKGETFTDELKIITSRDATSGAISAEVKNTRNYTLGSHGKFDLKAVTSIHSNNTLSQQLVLSNPVFQGLKLDITGSLQPSTGTTSAKTAIEFLPSNGVIASCTSVDALRGPLLTTDLATRFRDIQFGIELAYNVNKSTLDKYSVAISLDRAREKACLQAHTGFKSFTASYYQRFTDQLELAYRASWNTKVANLHMEIGTKWYLLSGAGAAGGFIKAKLDNVGKVGLAIASEVRPGLQVVLGATVDTAKLNENAHKLGLELNYSA